MNNVVTGGCSGDNCPYRETIFGMERGLIRGEAEFAANSKDLADISKKLDALNMALDALGREIRGVNMESQREFVHRDRQITELAHNLERLKTRLHAYVAAIFGFGAALQLMFNLWEKWPKK